MPFPHSALALLALLTIATSAVAGDWPQWRGPHRDGHADPGDLPQAWPDQLEPAWQLTVGEGHASPVVSDNRVYVFSRQADREIVRAIHPATGQILWLSEQPTWAHPALAAGRLVTKDVEVLTCWKLR